MKRDLQVVYVAALKTTQLVIDDEIEIAKARGDFQTKTQDVICKEIEKKVKVRVLEILSEVYS